jgi:hypothetical protein
VDEKFSKAVKSVRRQAKSIVRTLVLQNNSTDPTNITTLNVTMGNSNMTVVPGLNGTALDLSNFTLAAVNLTALDLALPTKSIVSPSPYTERMKLLELLLAFSDAQAQGVSAGRMAARRMRADLATATAEERILTTSVTARQQVDDGAGVLLLQQGLSLAIGVAHAPLTRSCHTCPFAALGDSHIFPCTHSDTHAPPPCWLQARENPATLVVSEDMLLGTGWLRQNLADAIIGADALNASSYNLRTGVTSKAQVIRVYK